MSSRRPKSRKRPPVTTPAGTPDWTATASKPNARHSFGKMPRCRPNTIMADETQDAINEREWQSLYSRVRFKVERRQSQGRGKRQGGVAQQREWQPQANNGFALIVG